MKKILLGLIILGIGSQMFTSCSSSNNSLSQFSKRKYLKKQKSNKAIEKDKIERRKNTADYPEDLYAAEELQPEYYLKEEVVETNKLIIPQKRNEENNIGDAHFEKHLLELNSDSLEYNDTIITNSDEIFVCKITSIGNENISYHFDPGSGKKVRRFIPKSRVKYYSSSLKSKYYKKPSSRITSNSEDKKMQPWNYVTIALLILSIPTFGVSAIFAIITAIIALNKIHKFPEKFKGKGWAIILLVLGVLALIFATLVYLYMLAWGM